MIAKQFYRFVVFATLALFGFSRSAAAAAAEWQRVFDPCSVVTLNLQLSEADWDRIRHDQPSQDEGWVPELAEAMMWAPGETPIRVQIRRKGQSDTPLPQGDPQKVSLKIDMNALVEGQKWRGLNKLSLENGSDSPLTEGFAWIAHRLAWEAGIYGYEAAYSGWVKLYVNGELKGVFVNAEQRDGQFLKNHGYDKGPGTWLYKVDGSSSLEVGIGDSPAHQHLCYAPFNSGPGKGGGDGCAQPNLEVDLPQWINIRGFFTLAAVEAFVENRDGLFTHSGKNSFAVDFDPPFPNTRLYFPWDQDTTIAQGNVSIYGNEPYQQTLLGHPWFGLVYEQLLRDLTDGPFSEAALIAVIDKMQAGLESAFDEDPYVYGGGSAAAFDDLRNWVRVRVPNVRSQLTKPYLPRPILSQNGGEVVAGFNLKMYAPAGAIYYTTDGSDPRLPGGAVSPIAKLYSASTPIVIEETTHVIARAFNGTTWSPLPATATFNIAKYANALRITELMYHPATARTVGDEDYHEFIELKNIGATALNVSGFYFDGVTYQFPPGTIIPTGGFYVLGRSKAYLTNRYPGLTVNGIYSGKLEDSGEKIRVRNAAGNTIISVEYDDDPPWPVSPDGMGYSLVLAEPFADPDQPTTWRASSRLHGSPGADDPAPDYGLGVVVNEILAHTDAPQEDAIELHNTSDTAVDISGWYLSDDFVRTNSASAYGLKKFRIPAGTVIAPHGFRVFYQSDFQTNNPDVPFALSEFGESVYLSGATASGALNGYVMGADFGASDNGVSFGRYLTSRGIDFVPLTRTTFGKDNAATLEEFRTGTGLANAAPRVGPIVINEIMYNPTGGGTEFLELMNISGAAIDLSGWAVAGADFIFPSGTSLGANELVLLVKTNITSVAAFRTKYSVPASVAIFGGDFVLENEGESLRLEKPNSPATDPAIRVERIRYNDKSPWPTEADGEGPSLERFSATAYGNDPVNWRTVAAGGSPGRLNQFNAGVAIAKQSSWNYHALGSDLGAAWREVDYSDAGWADGDGALGNGIVGLGTVVPFASGGASNAITTYFRKEFVINDAASAIANLRFDAMYDDAFVVYLNGTEILRSASMPAGAVSFGTIAPQSYNSLGYETFDLSEKAHLLQTGNNVLAVEVHQADGGPADLLWDASLTFDISTAPKVSAPQITPNGGSFTGSVQVTISASPNDAVIYYTLNGQEPDELSTRYTAALTIDTTTQVRARAFKPGYNESEIANALFTFNAPQPLNIAIAPAAASFNVSVSGEPNARYVIETSSNLLTWTESATITADAEGRVTYNHAPAANVAQMFYRCRPE